ncbi:hypothetical protein SDC9_162776 [bioreactor metagenome]|uniref:Uncharacterized protein n=1 Tax=bioreactor metagenome TaxID=1076179 RepID=A0A645FPC7_9ZZZZ
MNGFNIIAQVFFPHPFYELKHICGQKYIIAGQSRYSLKLAHFQISIAF